ncbi:MAG: Hsp20/alpha crystallin family protein [Chloroflexi bacterium]|nr:Hsp20/alpha crystallin family protein [Chloroflexota bacterium]
MAIELWQPWREAQMLRQAMHSLMSESLIPSPATRFPTRRPEADFFETEDSYWVEAALPGFRPEEVDITVEGDLLRICATKQEQPETTQAPRSLLREREPAVEYTFELPTEVEPEQAEARFEHGMLNVRLPKPEWARPHKIQISGARPQIEGQVRPEVEQTRTQPQPETQQPRSQQRRTR